MTTGSLADIVILAATSKRNRCVHWAQPLVSSTTKILTRNLNMKLDFDRTTGQIWIPEGDSGPRQELVKIDPGLVKRVMRSSVWKFKGDPPPVHKGKPPWRKGFPYVIFNTEKQEVQLWGSRGFMVVATHDRQSRTGRMPLLSSPAGSVTRLVQAIDSVHDLTNSRLPSEHESMGAITSYLNQVREAGTRLASLLWVTQNASEGCCPTVPSSDKIRKAVVPLLLGTLLGLQLAFIMGPHPFLSVAGSTDEFTQYRKHVRLVNEFYKIILTTHKCLRPRKPLNATLNDLVHL